MNLPKAKEKIERDFFQMRMFPKVCVWVKKKANERNMSYGEFCEAIFNPMMEAEKCAKKKQRSTQK